VGKKLYIGNLPDSATKQDLSDKFAVYGTVKSVKLITDSVTGRISGFGFIEMASEAAAQAAIYSLNGTDYKGCPMTVNEARTLRNVYGGGRNRR
jgi:RNA recognition motif-containing protein